MVLKTGSQPLIKPARRVPHVRLEPKKNEHQRMESAGIITRMEETSDWVSPLLTVCIKNEKLRVCMDPRNVNDSLKGEHFEMLRQKDIEAVSTNASAFSRHDANAGFNQIPLDHLAWRQRQKFFKKQ